MRRVRLKQGTVSKMMGYLAFNYVDLFAEQSYRVY